MAAVTRMVKILLTNTLVKIYDTFRGCTKAWKWRGRREPRRWKMSLGEKIVWFRPSRNVLLFTVLTPLDS